MAKGNLFLGMGRGKVGDVVFYRQYGEQVTRSRNRSPRNPNSYKQRVQRAIMANISRIYSLGYSIFDHAMEGHQVGQASQSQFVRRNVAILRNKVLAELKAGTPRADSLARVGAPGVSVAVPFDGMMLSQGSYPQQLFVRVLNASDQPVSYFVLPEMVDGTRTVSGYAQRFGMVPGDIYTIICIGVSDSLNAVVFDLGLTSEADFGRVYSSAFYYLQLKVKPSVLTDNTPLSEDTTLGSFFDVASIDGQDWASQGYRTELGCHLFLPDYPRGCIGVVRSREDSDLRSESYAYLNGNIEFGLTPDLINQAWNKELTQAGSDLILEGSDFPAGEA